MPGSWWRPFGFVPSTRVTNSVYKYKRLDLATDAIRLIRILKGDTGPIMCEIIETHLSQADSVPYEALSYVWGNNKRRHKIWVDGCLFTVTKNLFEALSNLRQPGKDRVLWIDAICIDQSHHKVSNNLNTWALPICPLIIGFSGFLTIV